MAYASVTYTSASGTTFALTNGSGELLRKPRPYYEYADKLVSPDIFDVILKNIDPQAQQAENEAKGKGKGKGQGSGSPQAGEGELFPRAPLCLSLLSASGVGICSPGSQAK